MTQRPVKEDFIISEPDITLSRGGPEKREDIIYSFDITARGDPVILFQSTSSRVSAGQSVRSLYFYDDQTLTEKAEWDDSFLKQRFRGIAQVKVLRSDNLLLVGGIRNDRSGSLKGLHVVDFGVNVLISFNEDERKLDPIRNKEDFSDIFAPDMLVVDEINRRIFQKFPFSRRIKVFNYEGRLLDEFPWPTSEFTNFVVSGDFLIREYFPLHISGNGKQSHVRGS